MEKTLEENNGVRYTYPIVNYENKKMDEITIRLIADKIIDENNISNLENCRIRAYNGQSIRAYYLRTSSKTYV